MKHPDATLLEQRLSKACPTTQHAAIIMALRDIVGVEKYGKTVDENPLRASDWAVHALEECADGLKYAIRAREEAEKLEMEVQALRTANAALIEKVRELEAWKESAMAVEREWDLNQLATMLGGQLGESQRAVIQWKVPILVQRVKRLEVAGDAMAMAEGCRCDDGVICRRCADRVKAWHAAKGQP